VRADPGSHNVSGIILKLINKRTNAWVHEEQLLICQHVSEKLRWLALRLQTKTYEQQPPITIDRA